MKKTKNRFESFIEFISFAGPAVFLFTMVVLVPFIFGIFLTFTNWDGISNHYNLVGLQNYKDMIADKSFWVSMGRTVTFAFWSVLLSNILGFLLALLVSVPFRGRNAFRTTFFTPNLIGGIVLGYIWQFVFKNALPAIGQIFGIEVLKKSWLSSPDTAMWALIIVTVWQLSGYLMIIYAAGLTSVPEELKEASLIDGCNKTDTLFRITIPMMVGTFTICIFLAITRCFVTYDVNLSLTEGGPFGETKLAPMYVYDQAFSAKKYGLGQTEAFTLFALVAIVALTHAKIGQKMEVKA
ncbi:carbohydrate ABC transporter permease [Fastidiosipila sanguinis]|uniref:ABC transporter permease n=1 Tax=Fastidiosipila sanguinis TaxID=236753 RepID=A0A2S0KNG1_9FIRM|nr:sugar ABC transporter permease [Fastidiosipila sanguinis]AVM42570.1 ABC transporter permease [Fastidiosipila sanguinis]